MDPMPNPLVRYTTFLIDEAIVPLLPRKLANKIQCSRYGLWNRYFQEAEEVMDQQWDDFIWPLIKNFNFSSVLELAPGAGRNTEKLSAVSQKIYAIDFNAYALEQCEQRLGPSKNGCSIEYFQNDGETFSMIPDNSISTIYCWDSAVHFDKEVISNYIKEFARVLKPGAKGFVHHSNLGDVANKNIIKNPHARSNMSKEAFAVMCTANKLQISTQIDVPWAEIVDCLSIFEKPSS